tara:strand:- start:770 stop:958 length:189 start_codon:yes stop_codon:yes gene_type:complete
MLHTVKKDIKKEMNKMNYGIITVTAGERLICQQIISDENEIITSDQYCIGSAWILFNGIGGK